MKEVFFEKEEHIVSKTDTRGMITYCNPLFIKMSGYTKKELVGKPHNIIRHQDMPKTVFKILWDTLAQGKEVFAYVKNKTKCGNYYWVYANVTPSFDSSNRVIGYFSVRRSPDKNKVKTIEQVYSKLSRIEKMQGVDAALKELAVMTGGVPYENFIQQI